MKIFLTLGLLAFILIGLEGCASVDNDVKVPQGSYVSHVLFTDVSKDPARPHPGDDPELILDWLMPLVEIDTQGFIHPHGLRVKDADSEDKPPVYVAYDISRIEMGQFNELFPMTQTDARDDSHQTAARARNAMVFRILHMSDCNFDAYTLRGQSYQDGEKLASDTLNTVGTATIGGTALLAPPAAAGLALTKLLVDSTNSNVQNSYLGGQAIDALFKAMAANRAKFKAQIISNLYQSGKPSPYQKYPVLRALGDIRELNRVSTLHGALEDLTQQAATQTQTANAQADKETADQKPDPTIVKQQAANAAGPVNPANQ
jgi:hypothetical protein